MTTCYCLYNLFLHPLASYPGPRLWAMTRIPYTRNFHSGKGVMYIRDLHNQYGPFVRLAPDIISVSHPDAMNQLQGHRKGKPENPKDMKAYATFTNSVVGADRANHSRMRRVMSHGFSAQASKLTLHFPR